MFTKEKLEKWMENLGDVIVDLQLLNRYVEDETIEKEIEVTQDILYTLEALHTSITSDGSI